MDNIKLYILNLSPYPFISQAKPGSPASCFIKKEVLLTGVPFLKKVPTVEKCLPLRVSNVRMWRIHENYRWIIVHEMAEILAN